MDVAMRPCISGLVPPPRPPPPAVPEVGDDEPPAPPCVWTMSRSNCSLSESLSLSSEAVWVLASRSAPITSSMVRRAESLSASAARTRAYATATASAATFGYPTAPPAPTFVASVPPVADGCSSDWAPGVPVG